MTIEVPTPSADLISQIETATIEALENETQAIAAIRARFAPYAKHNGFIKTADYDKVTSHFRIDREAYYKIDGKKARGLLALDGFSTTHTDQNRGDRNGNRLYLTEEGEWLQLRRVGRWTQWQGEAQWWYTDDESRAAIRVDDEIGDDAYGDVEPGGGDGAILVLTDAQVASEYVLAEILSGLGETMTELCKKLPDRFSRLKQRADLASRVLEAVK